MRRLAVVLTLLGLATLSLAGCGTSGGSPTGLKAGGAVHLTFVPEFEASTKNAILAWTQAMTQQDLAAVQKLTRNALHPQTKEDLASVGITSITVRRMMYDGATQEEGLQVAYLHATFEVKVTGEAKGGFRAGANDRYIMLVQVGSTWQLSALSDQPFPGITWG